MEEESTASERDCLQSNGKFTRQVVCKYYLLGKCSKGAKCLFLHEEDPEKTPVCQYYLAGRCSKTNCKFKHSVSTRECVFYNAGFCQYGNKCKFAHIKRTLCQDTDCKGCPNFHIDSEFMDSYLLEAYALTVSDDPREIHHLFTLCWNCQDFGHVKYKCPVLGKKRPRY